ncbi:MAG: MATE family efflux transporter, partial [Pacificimonas sp.]
RCSMPATDHHSPTVIDGDIETVVPGSAPARAASGTAPEDDRHLVTGPIVKTLALFALPLLTTNVLHSISGTWSAIWVSRVLGPDALVAVANANVFLFMMMGVVLGVGGAAGIMIGQAIGVDDRREVKRIVGTSISFVALASTTLAAVGYWQTPAIIALIEIPLGARDEALTYFRVLCLSMPPIFTFIYMMMMMRGTGDARTPFIFSCIWIGLTILLVPLLLVGWGPVPKLGIAGAALAGLIGNATALLLLVGHIYLRGHPIALKLSDFHHFRIDPRLLWLLLTKGAPMALEMLVIQGAYFVLLAMVNGYGLVTAAGYAAAAQLWAYVQMPAMAFAASMSAMVAQNIGADRWDRVREIALKGTGVAILSTGSVCLLVYALGDWPLRLFLPEGGEPLEVAREINYVVLWGWIVLAITSGLSAVVRANGAMIPPTIIYAITMWALRIPFARALQPWLEERAIWWSFPLGTVSSAVLAFAYWRWGKWRDNALLVKRQAPPARS